MRAGAAGGDAGFGRSRAKALKTSGPVCRCGSGPGRSEPSAATGGRRSVERLYRAPRETFRCQRPRCGPTRVLAVGISRLGVGHRGLEGHAGQRAPSPCGLVYGQVLRDGGNDGQTAAMLVRVTGAGGSRGFTMVSDRDLDS